jgi:DNA polymerase III subunit delta
VSPPVYLLTGEGFLVDEALAGLRAQTGADPLSEVSFEPRTSAAELLGALETPSLLGGVRLVVVRDAQDLLKEQTTALQGYLENPSDASILVLTATGRTKLDGIAKKIGTVVSLDAPKGRRLVGWLKDRAKSHSLALDDRCAWALLDTVGNELRDLEAALVQLSTGTGKGKPSVADIRKAFPRAADQRIYTFTDAVGDRRMAPAMTSLRRLLDQGEEPLVLFGALAGQVRRMLRARGVAERGPGAVGDLLGLPTWRAERLTKQARSYKEEELVASLQLLAETDVEMKGGDLPPDAALERAVVRIVAGRA